MNKKISGILALLLGLLMVWTPMSSCFAEAAASGEVANLTPNGGFEEGPWALEGAGAVQSDGETKTEGSLSARMTATDQGQIMVSDPIPVNPQRQYALSVAIRTDAIAKADGVFVGLLEVREDNSAVGWYHSDRLVATGGTHDWQPLEARLDSLNPSTAFVKLYLRMDSGMQGTAWFDDVRLSAEEVQQEAVTISIGSDKLGNIFSEKDAMAATVTLRNNSQEARRGTLQFDLKDYWGTVIASEKREIALDPGVTQAAQFPLDRAGVGYFSATAAFVPDEGEPVMAAASLARLPLNDAAAMPASTFFGAQTHFGQFKGNPADNLKLVSDMGGKFIRDEMYWSEIEKEKGKFEFDSRFDAYVNEAANRGIEPILILNYGNILYDKSPDGGQFRSPHTAEGLEAYTRYVKEVASRYKGKIHYYEVWNEPNGNQFWLAEPDAREYAAVLKAAYLAVKEADPQAVVIGGSVAGTDLYFLDDLFAAGGLNYMDALSIHPYRGGSPEYTNFLADIDRHRALMLQYGPIKPLWLTETGYPTTEAYYSPEEQARYVVRTYVQSMASGIVRMIDWYDFQDDGDDPVNYEHHFGLVDRDLTPKPAYAAYNAMVRQLDGAVYIGQLALAKDQYGYVFLKDGRLTTVLWSMQESEAKLPYEGAYRLTDMLGSSTDGRADGAIKLALKPEPIYVETAAPSVWAAQAATSGTHDDIERAKELLAGFASADATSRELWGRSLDDVAAFADEGLFRQAANAISGLQRKLLGDGGTTIALKDALALVSSLAETQRKLSGMQAAADPVKSSVALVQQADRLDKAADKLTAEMRIKTGEAGRLPAADVWLSEARERLAGARAQLDRGDAATAAAVLDDAEALVQLAEAAADAEPLAHLPVWTSLSRYEWSGDKTITVPVSVHNELDHAVVAEPTFRLPDGIQANAGRVTLAAHETGTIVTSIDGSAVSAGDYAASLTLNYTDARGRQAESVPMDFTLSFVKPVELTVEPLTATFREDGKIKVTVRNMLDRPVEGSFSAELPAQFETGGDASFDVAAIPPGESRTFVLLVRQASFVPLNEYVVRLKGTFDGVLVEAARPLDFEVAMKGTAVVDGDLADWPNALPVHLSDATKVHMIKSWTPDKASAVLWTMWDGDYVYLAAKVTDNTFYNAYTEGEVWRGDGLQAAFDTLGDATGDYNGDDYEYGFGLTPAGEQAYRWVAGGGQATGLVPGVKVAVKRDAAGGGATYEIAIPKRELAPLKLEAGTTFGMNLLLNDNDEGERLGWLEWTEGLGMYKNPSMFHKWTLAE